MPYNTGCKTALSNFEAGLDYRTVPDPAVMISFPIVGDADNAALVAWTTTPWTLPSNLALCVNANLVYAKGNNQEASDPPSETLRLLQLAVDEEEDDDTSRLVVPRSPLPMPPSHQSHRHGQDGQSLNPELQVQGEAVAGGATVSQQSLGQQMQGDCGGEVASAANAMFSDQEVPDGRKESPGGPWHFVGLMPLFDPPRHDSAETIRRALNLGVNVKMITCDQLAIGKEIGRRLGMGTNMYPSSVLLGQNKDESIAALPVDLIEKADRFAGVFPGCYSPYPTEVS